MLRTFGLVSALLVASFPLEAHAMDLDGSKMSFVWGLPFSGMLLSIALFPLLAAHFWEKHQGKIAASWAALATIPLAIHSGLALTSHAVAHTLIHEFIPFILLLLALFTVAGGIVIRGNLHGSPGVNTLLLALGTILASLIGTTGASMVMIRPIIRANDDRRKNVHVVVFFIFLVSNIGGSLTPLGDPPLFLGFLRGVEFFWTTTHLFAETVFLAGLLLAIFYVIDTYLYRRDGHTPPDPTPDNPLRISGGVNFILMAIIIATLLLTAKLDLGTVNAFGFQMDLRNIARDATLIFVVVASTVWTKQSEHDANGFSWAPMIEVAKLFAGIFITIIPVIAMLHAGRSGAFAPLVNLVTDPTGAANNTAYFWMTGLLSSFLDNAPTYLVFFELAGGNAQHLMTSGALTLAAISTGAVFMGANTYIGNAPNFMVYAIARKSGVNMPSFFGYLIWAAIFLLPLFALVSVVFFW